MTGCGCGHGEELHHPAGRCCVTLPALPVDELPAWSCPCRHYRPDPGPWGAAAAGWAPARVAVGAR